MIKRKKVRFRIVVEKEWRTKIQEKFLERLFEGSSDGLGGFGDGVLGEVSGELEADGGLDFSGLDGGLLVGAGNSGGLGGDLVEHVEDEGVQDLDALGGEGEALLGVLVDAVDEGVEARGVSLATGSTLLGSSATSSLGHFGESFFGKEVFLE